MIPKLLLKNKTYEVEIKLMAKIKGFNKLKTFYVFRVTGETNTE